MALTFGIDTSNYTTSAAVYDSAAGVIVMEKRLLPTGEGALGLRQSDAVFAHVKQLGEIAEQLFSHPDFPAGEIVAAGVSAFPRREPGSYMPCFLVGETAMRVFTAANRLPLYRFSHQEGHIAAALYSAGRLDLLERPFLAFHLSGGTTDALLVTPLEDGFFQVRQVGGSLDLKAGQAVDRVGLLLGLHFPCGPELTELALRWEEPVKVRPTLKGTSCCLSGIENQCRKLLEQGRPREEIARVCLESIRAALEGMTAALQKEYGHLPLLYAGGVMSSTLIRKKLEESFGGIFAAPAYSSDNAAGTAILAGIADKFRRKGGGA